MKNKPILLCLLPLLTVFACREEIVIDLEEGDPLIGVEASFTDELKSHEIILSYTADFYNSSDIRMISDAKVTITDGVDSIAFLEDPEMPGHYRSDVVAGRKNTLYRLLVDVPDVTEEDGYQHLYAESYMKDNVEVVDSVVMKPYQTTTPFWMTDTIICLYPYFQSLPDMSIVYMIHIWKNDTLLSDTLNTVLSIPMAGYAGYYVNAGEFLDHNMEIPIAFFNQKKLREGDRIKADLLSIPPDYMLYLFNLNTSLGSNPMMGSPTNIITNIQPEGKGVGWFYAASVASAETEWHK